MDITVYFILFMLWSVAGVSIYMRMKEIVDTNNALMIKDKNNFSKFKVVKGIIKRLGINSFYGYPELSVNDFEKYGLSQEDINEKAIEESLYKCLIEYEYIIGEHTYLGRNIGILPEEKDIKTIYKKNIGDEISIYVDEKDNTNSCLRKTAKETFVEQINFNIYKLMPFVIFWLLIPLFVLIF